MDKWFKAAFEKISKDKNFRDCRVYAGGKTWRCHKIVLSCASEFFERMLSGDFKESASGEIHLEDVSSDICEKILTYIYSYNKQYLERFNNATVVEILECGNKWLIPSIKQDCIDILTQRCQSMILSDLVPLFQCAHNIIDKEFIDNVIQAIRRQHQNSMNCPAALQLSSDVFQQYVIIAAGYLPEPERFRMIEAYIEINGFNDTDNTLAKLEKVPQDKNARAEHDKIASSDDESDKEDANASAETDGKPSIPDASKADRNDNNDADTKLMENKPKEIQIRRQYVKDLLGLMDYSRMTKQEFFNGPGQSDLLDIHEKYNFISTTR